MPLSYLHEDWHKQAVTHIWESQRFESMYTLQGKTRPTQHVRFPLSPYTPDVRFLRSVPICGNLSRVVNRVGQSHCSWEKGLPTQSTARRLTDPWVRILFLSWANQWSSGESQNIYQQQATRLTGPISPSCDRYVQYLLTGANRMVLNWHRRGLQPWRCRLSMYHSLTFPTSCLPFPLVTPPGLHFFHAPLIKPQCWVLKNLWPPHGLSTTRPSTGAYIYA
jgi:hypothetical protein